MASKWIIADSDDDEEDFSPIKSFAAFERDPRLDMEPLSPEHQPLGTVSRQPSVLAVANDQNDTSGSTDPSFFANIYDEQQKNAIQQTHLIESIVRLSQKASASSGDISSPANGKGKSRRDLINTSSTATEHPSPSVQKRPGPRKSQLIQISDATEFTPRKSAGKDHWDVPSSNDELNSTVKKRPKISEPIGDDSVKFYVAQSILSASQKRQYKKVQISDSHHHDSAIPESAAQMQPPSHYKSSCATTVAVSTPSRYASSGPRPPWETEQVAGIGNGDAAVDLTLSSPDAITTIGGYVQEEDQSPVRRSSTKRKRTVARDDVDELGQDGLYEDTLCDLDSEFGAVGRQVPKKAKKSSKPSNDLEAEPKTEPKKRGRKKKQLVTKELLHEQVQDDDYSSIAAPESTVEDETSSGKPKKKRGRPRRSDVAKPTEVSDEPIPAIEPTSRITTKLASMKAPTGNGITAIENNDKQPSPDPLQNSEIVQPEPTVDKSLARSVSPLKEADRNSLLISHSAISDSGKSVSKPMAPSQGGKAIYRVGLSKKSRIAPLLKIIRK